MDVDFRYVTTGETHRDQAHIPGESQHAREGIGKEAKMSVLCEIESPEKICLVLILVAIRSIVQLRLDRVKGCG